MPVRTLGLVALFVALATACGAENPSAPPSSLPTSSLAPSERLIVAADEQGQSAMSLRILDPGRHLAAARSATPAELTVAIPQIPSARIAAVAVGSSPGAVLILWVGFGCDRSGTVTVAETGFGIVVAPDPIENCDLVPSYRGVVLTFPNDIAPASIKPQLAPTEVLGA